MVTLSFTIFSGQKNYNRAHMLFQVLCGFEPIFYTTHPNEESDFFYINGNKYEYQDVIKCEIHYFDYFFINVLCLHIDMKNTSKSPLLLYSEDLDEGIDYKDIQLFKFYESVSEHLRIR